MRGGMVTPGSSIRTCTSWKAGRAGLRATGFHLPLGGNRGLVQFRNMFPNGLGIPGVWHVLQIVAKLLYRFGILVLLRQDQPQHITQSGHSPVTVDEQPRARG